MAESGDFIHQPLSLRNWGNLFRNQIPFVAFYDQGANMIKASCAGGPSVGIRPFVVVMQSERLAIQSLPDALPFQALEADHWETVFKKLSSFRPGCLLLDFDRERERHACQDSAICRSRNSVSQWSV